MVGASACDDELGFGQNPEQVDADLVTVLDAELMPVPFELGQNPLAAQVLAKAAPSGEVREVSAFAWLASPREYRGCQFGLLLLVDGPGLAKPLGTLLDESLMELVSQVIHIDR